MGRVWDLHDRPLQSTVAKVLSDDNQRRMPPLRRIYRGSGKQRIYNQL